MVFMDKMATTSSMAVKAMIRWMADTEKITSTAEPETILFQVSMDKILTTLKPKTDRTLSKPIQATKTGTVMMIKSSSEKA